MDLKKSIMRLNVDKLGVYYKSERAHEFYRFCVVGTVSAVIDAIIFYFVASFWNYQVALISGYLCGLIVNYVLTVLWTFRVAPSVSNAIGIILAHLINLFLIRMGIMWICVNHFSVSDKIAYIPTIIISVIANFLMVRFAVKMSSKKEIL